MVNKVIHIKYLFSVLNVILLIVFSNIAYAQTSVTISDTAFFNELKKNIPQVIDSNNRLIVSQARAYSGEIFIDNSNVSNINELVFFESINKITVFNTQLRVFPSISNLKNLEVFICNGNQLTEIPDFSKNVYIKQIIITNNKITSLPIISDFRNLEHFDVSYNKIQILPLFSNLPNLRSIVAFHNNISVITSFENVPNLNQLVLDSNNLSSLEQVYKIQSLKRLYLRGNKLTFSELNKLTNHNSYLSFIVFPQDTIGERKKIQFFNLNSKSLKLDNISDVESFAFDWYKNGSYLKSINGVDSLYFTNLLLSDTGNYTCVVKCINSNSPYFNKTVTYNFINLKFATCNSFNTLNFSVLKNDCKAGTDILIEESFNLGAYGPYNYTLMHDSLNLIFNYSNPKIKNLTSGIYSISIEDINKNCKVNIPSFIKIDTIANCITKNNNEYFTPDGDGINDNFYIDVEGVAHIFNRNGLLIKTIKTPAIWEGTDNNGILQDLGYYVIVLNNKQKIFINLLN
jgi:gliding motility-associated-like protein